MTQKVTFENPKRKNKVSIWVKAPLNSAALVILSQLQQHTKTLGEGFRGQLWDPRHTWAASCLDHLNGGVLFTAQRQHLSEIKLRGYCLKGQVRSKRQKMELFSGNWLIFAPHSSPSAAGGGKKVIKLPFKSWPCLTGVLIRRNN